MQKYFVFLFGVLCLVVLYFGHSHWKEASMAASMEGRLATDKIKNKEQKEKEALINQLKPDNNKHQSLLNFLHYKALTQEKVTICVIGGNVLVYFYICSERLICKRIFNIT